MKNILYLLGFVLTLSFSAGQIIAQTAAVNFLAAGTEDANKLLEVYFSPYGKAFGQCTNEGWVQTAKVHKTGGFDLSLTTSIALIPESDQTYDVGNLGLEKIQLFNSTGTNAPTIAGYSSPLPMMVYNENVPGIAQAVQVASFSAPPGTGYAAFALPGLKATLGLPLGFELLGSYFPEQNVAGDLNLTTYGFGLKHDLKQYMPFLKRFPIWHLAVMAAYSQFNSNLGLNMPLYGNPLVTATQDFSNQQLVLDNSSFTSRLIVSVNLPLVSVFTFGGLASYKTGLRFEGNYPLTNVETDPASPDFGSLVVRPEDVLVDPIDLEFSSELNAVFGVGARVKLGFVGLFANYTISEYQLFTGGLSFIFR